MSKNQKKSEERKTSKSYFDSKLSRVSLTLLAAFLTFGGPYVVLVLFKALDLNYAMSVASGFIVFFVGLALMLFLVRKKVIS